MKGIKLTVEPEHPYVWGEDSVSGHYDKTIVSGATLQPIGVRVGLMFSGSGFRNSTGTSQMRRGEYALAMAKKIVEVVNAAGGLEEDPFMEEYHQWTKKRYSDG